MQIRDDVTTTKFTIPKDEISCASASGVWKKIGIRPREECNLPTTDSGKICSGSNQCEGVCLADITDDQRGVMEWKENYLKLKVNVVSG